MSEEIKEIPLKERIEKLLESGWVNEFNYLESQLQEARSLVVILQQKVEQLEKEKSYANWYGVKKEKEVEQLENKIKYAQKIEQEYSALLTENTELENIRKEAIKYVQEKADYPISYYHCLNDLLNILNKGNNYDR